MKPRRHRPLAAIMTVLAIGCAQSTDPAERAATPSAARLQLPGPHRHRNRENRRHCRHRQSEHCYAGCGGPQPPGGRRCWNLGRGRPCLGCDVVLISVCSLRSDHLGAYGDDRDPHHHRRTGHQERALHASLRGGNSTLQFVDHPDRQLRQHNRCSQLGRGLPAVPDPSRGPVCRLPPGDSAWMPQRGSDPTTAWTTDFSGWPSSNRPATRPMVGIGPTPSGQAGQRLNPRGVAGQHPQRPPLVRHAAHSICAFPFGVDRRADDDATGSEKRCGKRRRCPAIDASDAGTRRRPNDAGTRGLGRVGDSNTVRRAGSRGVAVWNETYAVLTMDKDIQRALAAVAARGRRTVIVLVGDHGETLDDNNELLHGAGFFESVARVPLLISVPGIEPRVTNALASQADLLPTITALSGSRPPPASTAPRSCPSSTKRRPQSGPPHCSRATPAGPATASCPVPSCHHPGPCSDRHSPAHPASNTNAPRLRRGRHSGNR